VRFSHGFGRAGRRGAVPSRRICRLGADSVSRASFVTRGVYPSLYRGRLGRCASAWFGQTEERGPKSDFRDLLDMGRRGVETAFDMPYDMGPRSRSPRSPRRGSGARRAIDSLQIGRRLVGGIPMGEFGPR